MRTHNTTNEMQTYINIIQDDFLELEYNTPEIVDHYLHEQGVIKDDLTDEHNTNIYRI